MKKTMDRGSKDPLFFLFGSRCFDFARFWAFYAFSNEFGEQNVNKIKNSKKSLDKSRKQCYIIILHYN